MKVVPNSGQVQDPARQPDFLHADVEYRENPADRSALSVPYAVLVRPRLNWLILASMLSVVIYAAAFIYLSSAMIGGVRYFLLFDDEMISMRYAANLAHGFGLVWNPHGPHVEGFTNPLWVFIMAVFHLLPLSPAFMSLPVELLCAALGAINLVLVWRLAKKVSGTRTAAILAVLLTGAYFPLNQWDLRGTEVALLAPLVTLAVLMAVDTVEEWAPHDGYGHCSVSAR